MRLFGLKLTKNKWKMTLFNDTELFTTGLEGKKVFDIPDSELILIDNFFTKEESDRLYEKLLHQTKWREYEMEIYDKTYTVPRMISWYEDKDNPGADQNGRRGAAQPAGAACAGLTFGALVGLDSRHDERARHRRHLPAVPRRAHRYRSRPATSSGSPPRSRATRSR